MLIKGSVCVCVCTTVSSEASSSEGMLEAEGGRCGGEEIESDS